MFYVYSLCALHLVRKSNIEVFDIGTLPKNAVLLEGGSIGSYSTEVENVQNFYHHDVPRSWLDASPSSR